ncbi:MAG: FG-GAP repeat protein [Trueperaceae bacterium]
MRVPAGRGVSSLSAWLLVAVAFGSLTSCGASSGEGPPGRASPAASDLTAFVGELKLDPPAPTPFDQFGGSVALTSRYAVVGAIGSQVGGNAPGAAYVFDLSSSPAQGVRLGESLAEPGSLFGSAVAVDGDTVVVGAPYHSQAGDRAGAVFVFERQGSDWSATARLEPGDARPQAYFGESVAVEDGVIAVGAPGPGAGSAYVFVRGESGWSEVASLTPREPIVESRFGSAVALAGGRLAVGEWTADQGEAGRAHLYAWAGDSGAGGWTHQWTAISPVAGDRFGYALALSGETLAVAAPGGSGTPTVHVYRASAGAWYSHATLQPPTGANVGFGNAVAQGDGFLAIAAPAAGSDVPGAGRVLLYELQGEEWVYRRALTAGDPTRDAEFGGALDVAGTTLLVGAPGSARDGTPVGAAYRFESSE